MTRSPDHQISFAHIWVCSGENGARRVGHLASLPYNAAAMKTIIRSAMFLAVVISTASSQDVDTLAKVEKARTEVAACRQLLKESKDAGSVVLQRMKYSELDAKAEKLSHCGFVFRIVGDAGSGDAAGDESDRYDAIGAQQMRKFLKSKNLWNEFLNTDCRMLSNSCGSEK